ncbi:MAG: ribosome recycling factor [Chloroflexi bacterium]|nr:ribosome recycling factor [Chloroflexota bacterium]
MTKAIEALKKELTTIRTGRAHPALLEQVKVDYYGAATPINQLATISVPEARLLVIQPWDRHLMGAIEKAILKSELGLTPINDGNVIRLAIPSLTEERRRELVKMVHKRAEEGRVEVRNIRRDAMDEMRRREKSKELSEDDLKRSSEHLQRLTDSFIVLVEETAQQKEAELLQV